MAGKNKYSRELTERTVRVVFDQTSRCGSHWETIRSTARKLGRSAEALRNGVKRAEIDAGRRNGVTSEERSRIKVLAGERD